MNDQTITRPNAGFDDINQFARDYNEVVGNMGTAIADIKDIPRKVLRNNTPIFNQGESHDPSTERACGSYGLCKPASETRYNKGYNGPAVDPFEFWKLLLKLKVAGLSRGSGMTDNLNTAIAQTIIKGYAISRDIETSLRALANGDCFYWGAIKCSRPRSKAIDEFTPVFPGEDTYGHLFGCCGYDLDRKNNDGTIGAFAVIDNYGPKSRGGDGVFRVPFSQVKNLYTMCVLLSDKYDSAIDKTREQVNNDLVDRLISIGVTTGKEKETEATRARMLMMLAKTITDPTQGDDQLLQYAIDQKLTIYKTPDEVRAHNKIDRRQVALCIAKYLGISKTTDDEVIAEMTRIGIFNGKNGIVYNFDLMLMIARALKYKNK